VIGKLEILVVTGVEFGLLVDDAAKDSAKLVELVTMSVGLLESVSGKSDIKMEIDVETSAL
jgi:hypothetical protein